MKKLVICFSIAFLLVGLICSTSVSADLIAEMELQAGTEFDQTNALVANDRLYQSFDHYDNGLWIYPNDFSSTYVSGEKLIVRLTNISEENIARYTAIIGEYSDYTVFIKSEFSRNELEGIINETIVPIRAEGYGITGYYISEYQDEICVEVHPEKIEELRNYLSFQPYSNLFQLIPCEGYVPNLVLRSGDYITSSCGGVVSGITLAACGQQCCSYVRAFDGGLSARF